MFGDRTGNAVNNADVIVVGAGAAGLTAAAELAENRSSVIILEARDRIGGRMFTLRDSRLDYPVELGAEFIHGRPPEICDLLSQHKIPVAEVDGDSWCIRDGRLSPCDFFSDVDEILRRMSSGDLAQDESFTDFLERCCPHTTKETKQHAIGYVSGFNAADPAKVSARWLVQQMKAEEKIEGDRAFRSRNGYTDLLDVFRDRIDKQNVSVRTKTVVKRISWSSGSALIEANESDSPISLRARKVLVTLPLGVLQASAGKEASVEFSPALPEEKMNALAGLEMGKAIRVVLSFRERFWNQIAPGSDEKTLAGTSFLFSQDEYFPTWWTAMPDRVPMITGWAPFRSAEKVMSGKLSPIALGLQTLSGLLRVEPARLEVLLDQGYFHDWQSDPYSLGAYSYAKAGGADAPGILGRPLDNTVFFAGEATDTTSNNGTVHGAIASGKRAAAEVLRNEKPLSH